MSRIEQPTGRALAAAILAVLLSCCSDEAEREGKTTAAARPWTSDDPTPLRALLIGVADYPGGVDFADLRGPSRDVEALRTLLIDRFRIDAQRIHCLLDDEATLAGIIEAFDRQLLQRSQPGEEVLLFFSGHGSRVPDVSGRELGGLDSSLVAFDSRARGRRGEHDLTDDMLFSLLAPLARRGVHVTVVTDACHSGGVVRGGRFVARNVASGEQPPHATEMPFWPDGVRFLDDDERGDQRELTNYVHIAACSPTQRAFEYEFSGEGHRGLFTWSFLDTLGAAQPDDTYRDVAARAAATIQALPGAPLQSVWIEGTDSDRALFGSRFVPRPDFLGMRTEPGIGVVVDAGVVHGVIPGTQLAVQYETGEAIGVVTVESASPGTAVARWEGSRPEIRPGVVLRGSIAARPADLPKLEVHCADEELIRTCAGSAWAHVARDERRPYVLERETGGRLALRTSEGIPIWSAIGLAAQALERAFRREARFSALWCLADARQRGGEPQLTIAIRSPAGDELREDPGDPDSPIVFGSAQLEPHRDDRSRGAAAGELVATFPTFDAMERDDWSGLFPLAIAEVTSHGREPVHIHVLSLNEAREITVLFPDPGVRDRAATQGAPTKNVAIALGAMSAVAFPLDRPMRERYLVLGTVRPLDLSWLEARAEPERNRSAAEDAAMPGILRSVLGGRLTRGEKRIEEPGRGWSATRIDVLISRTK